MLNSILTIDVKITNIITNLFPHSPFLDYFFSFFSLKGSSIVIWLIIIALLILFEEKKDKRFIIYFFISFLLTAFLVNIVIKNMIKRPRPLTPAIYMATCPKDFSFPSGHAATAFASAATLSYFDKKRKYFYYLIASFIGVSRIYLGCHFFLDVVGGGIIGYLIGKTVILFKKYPV